MSKAKWGLGILSVLLAAAAGTAGYFIYEQMQSPVYLQGTTINGTNVTGMTVEEVADSMVTAYDGSHVDLKEGGEIVLSGDLGEFGYGFDREALKGELTALFEGQKREPKALVKSLIDRASEKFDLGIYYRSRYEQDLPHSFNQAVFNAKVNAASLSAERIDSVDAAIVYDKEQERFVIEPEVRGTHFEDAALQAYVKEQLDALTEGDPDDEGFYRTVIQFPEEIYTDPPQVTAQDQEIKDLCTAKNTFVGAKVTYVFGSKTQVLDYDKIMEMVDIDGPNATLNEDKLREYVAALGRKYDTRYKDRKFRTTYGGEITISAGLNEYGYTILEDQELKQLIKDIKSCKPVKREPIYLKTNDYGNPYYYSRDGVSDITGTYVECNLSAQHLWFYKNGKLICESDFVSGDVVKKGRATQTGCFPLAYKESPSILRGGEGSGAYETKVQFWMPFYEGQGLHDATWRGAFGGNIYKGDGSHGCINLPYWAAETIYNNITAGVPLVIYY